MGILDKALNQETDFELPINKNIMNKQMNDYCIKFFCSAENYRPYLKEINLDDGYLYATDTHIIARIKKEHCVKEYSKIEKYPNGFKIYEQHKKANKISVKTGILIDKLIELYLQCEYKKVRCSECDGDGTNECHHCGSEYECDNCNGTGKEETNKIILTSDNEIKFLNGYYTVSLFNLIIQTALFLREENIIVHEPLDINQGTLFMVGDFEIILMQKHK